MGCISIDCHSVLPAEWSLDPERQVLIHEIFCVCQLQNFTLEKDCSAIFKNLSHEPPGPTTVHCMKGVSSSCMRSMYNCVYARDQSSCGLSTSRQNAIACPPSPRVYGMMRRAAVVAAVLIARSPDDRRLLAFVTRCNPSRTNRNDGSRRKNYRKCGSCLLCRLLRAAIPPKISKNVPGARKGDTVPYPLTPSFFSVDCFIFLFLDDQAPPAKLLLSGGGRGGEVRCPYNTGRVLFPRIRPIQGLFPRL